MQPDRSEAVPAQILPPVREIPFTRPFRWLALGWRDFSRAFMPSLLHGVLAALGGFAILGFAWGHLYLLAGALSGFLLVGPILATGLYALSRQIARGEPPQLSAAFAAWRCGCMCLMAFGLLLAAVATIWVLFSYVLFAWFAPSPVSGLESFLRHVVLSRESALFEAWLLLGGLLASLVFAASVVTAPLLLERDADMRTAILTSTAAVVANPLPMALWAALIMAATALGMATLMLGLILAVPVIGHASWHAYVDLVDAAGLPLRR